MLKSRISLAIICLITIVGSFFAQIAFADGIEVWPGLDTEATLGILSSFNKFTSTPEEIEGWTVTASDNNQLVEWDQNSGSVYGRLESNTFILTTWFYGTGKNKVAAIEAEGLRLCNVGSTAIDCNPEQEPLTDPRQVDSIIVISTFVAESNHCAVVIPIIDGQPMLPEFWKLDADARQEHNNCGGGNVPVGTLDAYVAIVRLLYPYTEAATSEVTEIASPYPAGCTEITDGEIATGFALVTTASTYCFTIGEVAFQAIWDETNRTWNVFTLEAAAPVGEPTALLGLLPEGNPFDYSIGGGVYTIFTRKP